jgi:hypothetical protein
MTTSATTSRWELLDLQDGGGFEPALSLARRLAPTEGLGARFLNVEWKLGPTPDPSAVNVWVFRNGTEAYGIAPFLRQSRPLVFHFGEVAIGSVDLTRFTIIGDIYVDTKVDPAAMPATCKNLIERLVPTLASGEGVFFEGLPIESATYRSLSKATETGAPLLTIQIGEPFEHQFISMPETFEEYVQGLGSRSRQSVQYSARRLDREMNGQVVIRKFESVDSVSAFLKDTAAVSSKTYQTNLLGLGIHEDNETLAQLTFAAERGWFRSYILYCNDKPTAFMLGHQYGGCYYYDDVGYDPDFAKWSVGTVLQLKVIEELYSAQNRPRFFDFSTGYGSHKGRFGNLSRREVNLLVLPKTAKNIALRATYLASVSASTGAVRLLTRIGAKDRLKKMIRRWKSG